MKRRGLPERCSADCRPGVCIACIACMGHVEIKYIVGDFMKFIITAVITLATFACLAVTPEISPPYQHDVKITSPEDVFQYNDSLVYFGLWKIEGPWQVEGHYYCPIEKVYGFWPVSATCKGFLSLYDGTLSHNDAIISTSVRPDDMGLRVGGKVVKSGEVFNLLQERNTEIVELESQRYQLQGLFERAKAGYSKAITGARQELFKARIVSIVIALAAIVASIGAAFIIRWLYRKIAKTPEVLKRFYFESKNAAKRVLVMSERNKVRRVVMDEVIREATRSALNCASEDEKSALRSQIKQAIDDGNHEVAKSLLSVLQRMES